MKRALLIGTFLLSGCDDDTRGLCKIDSDCPSHVCRDRGCLAPDDAGAGFLGAPCTAPGQCASGICADGVCCDSPCDDQICQRCDSNSTGGSGHCGFSKEGTDLDGECPAATTSCWGACSIQKTTRSCSGASYTCADRRETVPVPSGSVCAMKAAVPVSRTHYCEAGDDCADGKCQASRWWTSCDGRGNCRAARDAEDALMETIVAEAGASLTSACGTNGTSFCGESCLGNGVYRNLCDGAGHCTAVSSTQKSDCGPYACDSAGDQCKSQCSADADCAQDLLCMAPVCHWDWEWASWAVSASKSFTVNTDTVKDDVTGLEWQRGVSDAAMSWDAANVYCAALSLSGAGWRLPTAIELLSIVDWGRMGPAVDTSVFSLGACGARGCIFWTSTPSADSSGRAWFVDFYDGGSYNRGGTSSADWVRCVR